MDEAIGQPRPCWNCEGKGFIVKEVGVGRRWTDSGFEIHLPDDLIIPACTHCGDQWIDLKLLPHLEQEKLKAERWKKQHGWTFVGNWVALKDGDLVTYDRHRWNLEFKLGRVTEEECIIMHLPGSNAARRHNR